MKFSIDIDCTPEEARAFFGLPPVEQMNAAIMKQVEERMMDYLGSADPEAIARNWLPGGLDAFEQMQKAFLAQFTAADADKKND